MKIRIHVLNFILVGLTATSVFAAEPIWLDPKIQTFVNGLNASGGKPMEQLAPKDARQVLVGVQASAKTDLYGISILEKTITEDGVKVSLTIVRPEGVNKILPAFMFFHGGGWVLGDFKTHERFVRDLVVDSGAVAVFVNYTPSPEAHYPVAINQAYAATKWVAEHGQEINVDGTRLAVSGNSVGGNMATVVALMAKEKSGPKLKLQLLFWPVTNAAFDKSSYNKYASGYFLTKGMMKWFWDNYTTDSKQRKEIHASPALATTEQLRNLPPAVIQTAENHVLRDEGESYVHKLAEAGVDVTSTRYNGAIHDFGLLNPIEKAAVVRSALLDASAELRKHLK
jgi:acetyl esterase/lipase